MPSDMLIDDDEVDINLRSATEIEARLAVLIALARRGFIELDPNAIGDDESLGADGECFDLIAWLRDRDAWDATTAWERELFTTEPGTLSSEDAITATWSVESLAPLAAATMGLPMQSWEPIPTDAVALLAMLPKPEPEDSTGLQIHGPSDEEAAAMRETAELWHWRCAIEAERRSVSRQEREELAMLVAEVASEALDAGLLENLVEEDFCFAGRPFRSIGDRALERGEAIAAQRLAALNWLAGFGDSWDDTPLEV